MPSATLVKGSFGKSGEREIAALSMSLLVSIVVAAGGYESSSSRCPWASAIVGGR